MFPKHDLFHRPTFIKHIRMGNFEFYVKFYDNFSNNIICSEHLTVVTYSDLRDREYNIDTALHHL